MRICSLFLIVAAGIGLPAAGPGGQGKLRARDLGIPFEGTPGPRNAITDVAGLEVGMTTLIQGDSVRTGVTAVLPRGKASTDPVFAAWFPLNGNGEMTGTAWIDEAGFLEGPVFITNTHSVGVVRDAYIQWAVKRGGLFQPWALPVVAETYDGELNDINGFHVAPEHVVAALETASAGTVPEGNTGGGTGMICYGFKCGTGTASRRVPDAAGGYTVGVLVQANHGSRRQLRIAGVAVGAALSAESGPAPPFDEPASKSIIIVIATDAPLLPHQLKRIARRAALGLARTGSIASNGSGDIFVAFSTANAGAASAASVFEASMLSNRRITALFDATVQATEEAIINALIAGETMTGFKGARVAGIPHARVREILKRHGY
jgi:D-aminopeptidase